MRNKKIDMPELKERNIQIFSMSEQGNSYARIATHFNISSERVKQIVKTLQQERTLSEQWPFWSLLSNRSRNSLNKAFGEEAFSHPQVLLKYGRKHIARLKEIGKYSLREIDNALTHLGLISKGQEW